MSESALAQEEFLIPARSEPAEKTTTERVQPPDSHLIAQVLAGDETAFEEIFERYKRLVAATAARYFEQPEQIEEIVQITFTKVYFQLKNFRGAHDFSLVSWLGKITTNACLDFLKQHYRKTENLVGDFSAAEQEILFAGTNFENDAEKSLIKRDLTEKLLQNIHPRDRALLQMLYAEELSVEQIAAATGWSNSAIKVRAFRARRALRKILRKLI